MVGLEEVVQEVSEDVRAVELCVKVLSPAIECPIEFPFDVGLSTMDGIAGKRNITSARIITCFISTQSAPLTMFL